MHLRKFEVLLMNPTQVLHIKNVWQKVVTFTVSG